MKMKTNTKHMPKMRRFNFDRILFATTTAAAAFSLILLLCVVPVLSISSTLEKQTQTKLQTVLAVNDEQKRRRRIQTTADSDSVVDFGRLNDLLSGVVIQIDDKDGMMINEKVGLVDLELIVESLTCGDITIDNINMDHDTYDEDPTTIIDVSMGVNGVDATCQIVYEYKYGFLKGEGTAEIITIDNAASASMQFVSTRTENEVGAVATTTTNTSSSIEECTIQIEIDDINFIDADFASNVIGIFERFLRDVIEREIEKYGCDQLSTTGVTLLNDQLLSMVDDILETHSSSASSESDVGAVPSIIPDGYDISNALNFQEIGDTEIGRLIEMALKELDTILGGGGGNGNDGDGDGDGDELGINNLLRTYVLDENRALVLNTADMNGLMTKFELHDQITQTDIVVDEIRLYGLDTMTKFDPLIVTGEHTIRNEFAWKYIRAEIDVILDIKPSSLDDALLVDTMAGSSSSSNGITETITIGIGAENIDAIATIFALIDSDTLSGFTVGSVLGLMNTKKNTDDDNNNDNGNSLSSWILPCLLSAVKAFQFTELVVTVDEINVPTINKDGFIDTGIDKILTEVVEIVFDIYHDTFVENVLPNMFDTTIKNLLNDQLSAILLLNGDDDDNDDDDACPKYDSTTTMNGDNSENEEDRYIDFNEFFGGGMNNEYGPLPSMLHDLLDEELLQGNPTTGMPKINDVLIDPLTEGRSGIAGTVVFDGGGGSDDDDDDGYLFNVDTGINLGGLDANIKIRSNGIRFENLDTVISPLILLDPVPTEPYRLNNSVTMGLYPDRPVKMSTTFAFEVIDKGAAAARETTADDSGSGSRSRTLATKISNELDVSLEMYDANVVATVMIQILKSEFLNLPIVDAFDYNCWIALIPPPTLNEYGIRVEDEEEPTAALTDFIASVGNIKLNMTCIECTSPGVIEMTELLSSSSDNDDDANNPNPIPNDVTDLVNRMLLYVQELVEGDLVQVRIDRLINNAHKRCPHSPMYDPEFVANYYDSNDGNNNGNGDNNGDNSIVYEPLEPPDINDDSTTQYLMMLGIVSLALILAVSLIVLFVRCFTRRRHRRWLLTLPAEQVDAMKQLQQKEESIESELNKMTRSMFASNDDIPCIVRWGMPVVIIGNIGLFLSGHLNLGATVNIEAEIAGETLKVDQFFEFSMAKSTIDIWNAGGKELAILILIFSGIWPYTKQFITLALWFTPTSRVSISRRGSALLWLDWLAKWSMIDIFVLIISLAAFRVSIESPSNLGFLPENFYSINLLVVPLWGLYSNMIAQLVSQISSHFIIHYHRKILNNARKTFHNNVATMNSSSSVDYGEDPLINDGSNERDDSKKVLLRTHRFGRPHRGINDSKLVVRNWVNPLLIVFGVGVASCILAGCVLATFSIEILGLIGVAVESGQEFREAKFDHSVFTVIRLLMDEAKFLDTIKAYIGLGSFSFVFVLTVLIVPICQSIALLMQWFVPMTVRQQTRSSVLVEVLQAWQYAEVYLIAIFVASWQLGPISSFMVNEYCESLGGFFAEMVFYGIIKDEDAQCFSVKSSIEVGFYIMAVGAILLHLLNTFVTNAMKQHLRDVTTANEQQQQRKGTATNNKSVEEEHIIPSSTRSSSGSQSQEVFAETEEGIITDHRHQTADATTAEEVHPVPVLFTDKFRWLLTGTADDEDDDSGEGIINDDDIVPII